MAGKIVYSNQAPDPIGPYSQAVIAGNFLFSSGQIAIDKQTGKIVPGGVEEQTRQVLKNIEAVLKSVNSGLQDIVKVTIYLSDMNDFSIVNQIYTEYFGKTKPARSTVEVNRLPKDVSIEIDCIAYLE